MEQQLGQLKSFVDLLKKNPDALHHDGLKFFREYIESLGGTIPPKPASETGQCPFTGGSTPEAKNTEPMADSKTTVPEEPMETEPEIPMPELDNEGVIEADVGEPLPMGADGKEPSEEDAEKASEERDAAQASFGDGDFETALTHFTAAIELNPGSAILHAKRANCLLKLRRPKAAIADCDRAIFINPDSATAYKFRGRAHRLLGHWLEAHADLAMACKLDYDDLANEWLKEVEPNAKKLQAWLLAKERAERDREIAERKERIRKAQEAREKARKEEEEREQAYDDDFGGGFPGAGGFPGGGMGMPPGADKIFSDPDFQEALKDPSLMAALSECMQNPAAITKHMGNPKLVKIFSKLMGGLHGGPPGAGMGGCGGGAPCGDASCGGEGPTRPDAGAKAPPKAPEPDLD